MTIQDYSMLNGNEILCRINPDRVQQNVGRTNADPMEFCVVAWLVFFCGARRDEIVDLRFEHAFSGDGRPRNEIRTRRKPIPLTDCIKVALREYRRYLEAKYIGSVALDQPLFPSYGYPDKVTQHFKKFLGVKDFLDVHHEGIRYTYYKIWGYPEPHKETYRKEAGVKRAANCFRLSSKQVFGILIGSIQLTGNKPIYQGIAATLEKRRAETGGEPEIREMTNEEQLEWFKALGIENKEEPTS